MNNKRFGNDDNLNKIYKLVNETRFRNYIYDYGSEYCDYIDEYEVAIDDRNDRILELEQALDEIEKYITTYIKIEDKNENVKVEFNELLKIIQKTKGDVKNENNNV